MELGEENTEVKPEVKPDDFYQPDPVVKSNDEPEEAVEPKPVIGSAVKPEPLPIQPEEAKPKTKKSKKPFIIVLVILLLLLAGAGAVWYFIFNKPAVTNNNSGGSSNQQASVAVETNPDLLKMISPTTGETWLDTPIALTKQGYFKANQYSPNAGDDGTYFQVGARGANEIIAVESQSGGMRGAVYLFEKSPSGEITYMSRPNALAVYNTENESYLNGDLVATVKIDTTTRYDSLNIPTNLALDTKGSIAVYNSTDLGYFYKAPTDSTRTEEVVKQIGKSSIIKSQSTNADTGLTSIYYFMKTAFNSVIGLKYEPLPLDLLGYQWSTGKASAWSIDSSGSAKLKSITRGCGGSASVSKSNNITDADVQEAGKSANGLTVYQFKSSSNTLLTKAYDEYYQSKSQFTDKTPVTLAEFVDKHGLVLFKDVNAQWLVYVREDLAPYMSCAKPVVYLYPTTAQNISVRVGADVKVSDPLYSPQSGWTAYAQPNGQLTVNGIQYGSLFWEGPGYGQYPGINSGTVVKYADVIGTIRQQLAQQGLNATESNEFVDYWQDQIPNKPYVRLTWLNTAQMDELAPLYISPKPDTMIRVFLDMSGLDNPINIPAQNLTSIPRNGFTVVEWGGLSSKKLY
ncbi:MAG: hypothetical protein WCP11_02045 [Candidatus Saccharibacteria bacterium]